MSGLNLTRFVGALHRNLTTRVTWERTTLLDYGRTYHYEFTLFPHGEETDVFRPFSLVVKVNESWDGTLKSAVQKVADAVSGTHYRISENARLQLRGLIVELGERSPIIHFETT